MTYFGFLVLFLLVPLTIIAGLTWRDLRKNVKLPPELHDEFRYIVDLAGSALPVDMLIADLGGEPEKFSGVEIADEALAHSVLTTVERLREFGTEDQEITEMLRVAEPFRSNWARTEHLLKSLQGAC